MQLASGRVGTRIVATAAVVAAGLLWFAEPGEAFHERYSSYSYTADDDACHRYLTEYADPVTVHFYGTAATAQRVYGHRQDTPPGRGDFGFHTSWEWYEFESRQRMPINWEPSLRRFTACPRNPESGTKASIDPLFASRSHARFWTENLRDHSSYRIFWTHVTPHYEDFVSPDECPPFGGHAVRESHDREGRRIGSSGFDTARRYVTRVYFDGRHRHQLWSHNAGNTETIQQCDGGLAASNGTITEIRYGRENYDEERSGRRRIRERSDIR